MNLRTFLARFNPTVPRHWLLALAGLMWSAVGILLITYAVQWVTQPVTAVALSLGLLGLAISIATNLFGFSKLAHKNIERIMAYEERACAFAFQAWKSWLIIAVMMAGGMLLRHSAIPRPVLAVPYAAVGGGLFQASIKYYLKLGRLSFARAA